MKRGGKVHIERDEAAVFVAADTDQFSIKGGLHLLLCNGGYFVSGSDQAGFSKQPEIFVEFKSHAAGSNWTAT